MDMNIPTLDTPVGTLAIMANNGALVLCDWTHSPHFKVHENKIRHFTIDTEYTHDAVTQLKEYFDGKRKLFDIEINPVGTEFQLKIWKELCKIEYGSTVTYTDIAAEIGNRSAVRCVANAIAQNPVNIIIPCHRVIGANGSLTGYAGGLDAKKWLLQLEQKKKSKDGRESA